MISEIIYSVCLNVGKHVMNFEQPFYLNLKKAIVGYFLGICVINALIIYCDLYCVARRTVFRSLSRGAVLK